MQPVVQYLDFLDRRYLIVMAVLVLILPGLRRLFFSSETRSTKIAGAQERDPFFDVLKGIAIMCVVLIHTVDFFRDFPYGAEGTTFIFLMNNIGRFAIPLFLICSGALLRPLTGEKLKSFYTRKIVRILIPYLLFTLLFTYVRMGSLERLWYFVYTGRTLVPYYFVVILFQLYLLYPFIERFREQPWFLPTAFGISFLSFMVPLFWDIADIHFVGQYLFFFCFGIAKRQSLLSGQFKVKLIYPLMLIGGYLLFFVFDQDYYYNFRPFYGIAIFSLLYLFRTQILDSSAMTAFFSFLGRISLWIFLIHFVIVEYFYFLIRDSLSGYHIPFVLIFFFSLITSAVLSYLLSVLYGSITKPVLTRTGRK